MLKAIGFSSWFFSEIIKHFAFCTLAHYMYIMSLHIQRGKIVFGFEIHPLIHISRQRSSVTLH